MVISVINICQYSIYVCNNLKRLKNEVVHSRPRPVHLSSKTKKKYWLKPCSKGKVVHS